MENEVPLENSAASAPQNIASSEHHEYHGFDTKHILENSIKYQEEIRVEISIKPKPGNILSPEDNTIFSIELILKEEFPNLFTPNYLKRTFNLENCSADEQTEKLQQRCNILRESFDSLFWRVLLTVNNLERIYDPKDYNFFVDKRTTKPLEAWKLGTKVKGLDLDIEGDSTKNKIPNCVNFTFDEYFKVKNEGGLEGALKIVTEETTKENPNPPDEVLKDMDEGKVDEPKKRKLSYLQPETAKKQNINQYPIYVETMVIIGPNGTMIEKKDYEGLQLKGAPGATRLLCDFIFGDEILASHSLTGNQSPAFRGRERPAKKQLDTLKIADITHLVCSKFNVNPQLVRGTITTKCADSAKKLKRLLAKTM